MIRLRTLKHEIVILYVAVEGHGGGKRRRSHQAKIQLQTDRIDFRKYGGSQQLSLTCAHIIAA